MTFTPDGLNPALAEKFQQIRTTFIAGLANREVEIAEALSREHLNAVLHRLVGAAGAFGFEDLSQLARVAMESSHDDDEVHVKQNLVRLVRAMTTIRSAG